MPEDGEFDEKTKEAIANLSKGVTGLVEQDLNQVQNQLSELTQTQTSLLEALQQENARYKESIMAFGIHELFEETRQYYMKLQNIKRDMIALTELSAKLKKRALKLQQSKEKEALARELQRQKEAEREQYLVAKMATKH